MQIRDCIGWVLGWPAWGSQVSARPAQASTLALRHQQGFLWMCSNFLCFLDPNQKCCSICLRRNPSTHSWALEGRISQEALQWGPSSSGSQSGEHKHFGQGAFIFLWFAAVCVCLGGHGREQRREIFWPRSEKSWSLLTMQIGVRRDYRPCFWRWGNCNCTGRLGTRQGVAIEWCSVCCQGCCQKFYFSL